MPLGRLTFIFVKINLSEKQRRTEVEQDTRAINN